MEIIFKRQSNFLQSGHSAMSDWDKAIADAQELISQELKKVADAKLRIKRLKLSIAVFQERKEAGDPWPGDDHGKPQRNRRRH